MRVYLQSGPAHGVVVEAAEGCGYVAVPFVSSHHPDGVGQAKYEVIGDLGLFMSVNEPAEICDECDQPLEPGDAYHCPACAGEYHADCLKDHRCRKAGP